MKRTILMASVAFTGAAILAGQLNAAGGSNNRREAGATGETGAMSGLVAQPIGGGVGPDVTVGSIGGTSGIVSWGQDTSQNIVAYSFGTTSCNVGTMPLAWFVGTPNHPVISQNMYRLHNGRFEQLGQSWLKHGFCALQQTICQACSPVCGGCCAQLGVGCSDPYSASRNGSQDGLGPKSQINAAVGSVPASFPFPVPAAGDVSGAIFGRLQVKKADLYNVNFPGARFFTEGQYIGQDDAAAGNDDNNASWREVTFSQPVSPAALPGHTFFASLLFGPPFDGTHREEVALNAWQDIDTNPNNIVPVTLVNADVSGDGRFVLGYKVLNNLNGTYTYEYALLNLNSDRSARQFTVPRGTSTVITALGFHDVDYHSANGINAPIYSGTDWSTNVTASNISFFTETFAANPNANALRWATMYNFRFTANTAPTPVNATVLLFKTGTPASVTIPTHGPSNGTAVVGDLNGDGVVNTLDLGILLASWTLPPATTCSGAACLADLNGDGVVNSLDLGMLLAAWTL